MEKDKSESKLRKVTAHEKVGTLIITKDTSIRAEIIGMVHFGYHIKTENGEEYKLLLEDISDWSAIEGEGARK